MKTNMIVFRNGNYVGTFFKDKTLFIQIDNFKELVEEFELKPESDGRIEIMCTIVKRLRGKK